MSQNETLDEIDRVSTSDNSTPSGANFVKIAENDVMQDEDASYVVYTALFTRTL